MPIVESSAASRKDPGGTSHVISFGGTTVAGELLVAFIVTGGVNPTTPAGWTRILNNTGERAYVYTKISDGTEGTSVTITTPAGVRSASNGWRISGHNSTAVEVSAGASGVDPDSLSPSWGSKETLWLALQCAHASDYTFTSPPSGYGNFVSQKSNSSSSFARCGAASASIESEAASEDPGVFTLTGGSTTGRIAYTIAVEGGSGISGDLAVTEAPDTATVSGSVIVQGDLAATEAQDTASASGGVTVQGDLAASEAPDTAAITGAILVQGDFAATEATDTAAASGVVLVQGDMAATESPDVAAFNGAGTVEGDLAATEAPDTAALAGGVVVQGELAATEAGDTASMSAGLIIQGTLAATEAPDTAAFAGAILVQGDMAVTEAQDTAAFTSAEPFVAPERDVIDVRAINPVIAAYAMNQVINIRV